MFGLFSATPAAVPVEIISPGSNVIDLLSIEMIDGIFMNIFDVVEFCLIWPLIFVVSLSFEVVGISKDNIKSHLSFKKKYKVPFELLSDEKVNVQKKFGVWGKKSFMGKKFMGTIRSTIIIKNGKILKIWSNVRVKDHAQEVLNYIKSL